MRDELDWARLEPVFETVDRVKANLPPEVALIGFCGAPWTVASYMIAGHGTPDQAPARLFAYREPKLFAALIDRLADVSADYLARQIRAGAEAVQIFELVVGRAAAGRIRALVRQADRAHARRGCSAAAPQAPVIAFPRGAATQLAKFAALDGLAAIGLDTAVEPRAAAAALPARLALQGNLDPLALLAGGRALDEGVERVVAGLRRPCAYLQPRPRHPSRDADRACRAAGRAGARGGLKRGRTPMNAIWTRAAALAATVALAGPAAAQSITINGVARSVSLMRDMAAYCPDVIPAEAQKFADAFLEIGHKSYGRALNSTPSSRPRLPRREQEVRAAGAASLVRDPARQSARPRQQPDFPLALSGALGMVDMDETNARQARAREWFEALQLSLIAAMEALEAECPPGARAGRRAGTLRAGAVEPRRSLPARRAAAGAWRCCAAGCSRKWARTPRPSTGLSRRNSPSRFPAPRTIRASGPRGFR